MGQEDLLIYPGQIKIKMLPAIENAHFTNRMQLTKVVRIQLLGALIEA